VRLTKALAGADVTLATRSAEVGAMVNGAEMRVLSARVAASTTTASTSLTIAMR
jgi:hypothetical protein